MTTTLIEKNAAYIAMVKAQGGATGIVGCPHCGKDHETTCPLNPADSWDSLVVCPHCGEMFKKEVTSTGSAGMAPGKKAAVRNWDASPSKASART